MRELRLMPVSGDLQRRGWWLNTAVSPSEFLRATVMAHLVSDVDCQFCVKFVQYSSSGLFQVLVCEDPLHSDYFGLQGNYSIYQSPVSIARSQQNTPRKGHKGTSTRKTRSAPGTPLNGMKK